MRVRERIVAKNATVRQARTKRYTKTPKLYLRNDGDIVIINVPEIIFVEIDSDKRTIIHTGRGEYQSGQSLAEIYEQLSKHPNIIRTHKSFLINLDMAQRITPWGDSSYKVEFFNYDKEALISRKYAREVRDLFS